MSDVEFVGQTSQVRFSYRARILGEDLTLAALSDLVADARAAGQPANATVTLRPGDCVIEVTVETYGSHQVPRFDEAAKTATAVPA